MLSRCHERELDHRTALPPHRAHSPPPSSALPSNIAPWPCDERTHLTLNSMQRAPSVVRWAYNRGAAWCAAIVYRAVLPTALSLSRKSGRLETKFNGRTAEGSESFQLSGELTCNGPSPYSANALEVKHIWSPHAGYSWSYVSPMQQ